MDSVEQILTAKSKKSRSKSLEKVQCSNRCAGYIRVSTEEQASNPEGSIKNQEDRIRHALEFKNSVTEFGQINHIFTDAGLSGKDMNRPELRNMLKLVSENQIDMIIVSDLSRLSRSIRDFSQIWEFLQAHDCKLWSLRENFDTSTAAGEMMLFSIANFAQYERKQTAERVSANFQSRAGRGLHNGGNIPLGYELDLEKPGHFKINESQAHIIKLAFSALIREGSIAGAAKWLNQQSISFDIPFSNRKSASKLRSKMFHVGNLTYILTNPAYIGIRRYKPKKGKALESKAAWPAIIGDENFTLAQKVIQGSKKRKLDQESRYPYLLSGKVFCQECGQALIGKSAHGNGGKIAYYEHGSQERLNSCLPKDQQRKKCEIYRVQAIKIEKKTFSEVVSFLEQPELSKILFDKYQSISPAKDQLDHIKKIDLKLQNIDDKINSLIERISELPKSISATKFYDEIEKLQKIKAESEVFRNDLLVTNTQNDKLVQPLNYEKFLVRMKRLVDEDQSFETKKSLVGMLIHKIETTVQGFEVSFYLGDGQIKKGLANANPSFLSSKKILSTGSFRLTNGGGIFNNIFLN